MIIKSSIGHNGGTFALLTPLIILALLCGIACTTASSRCIWAFARDGALPASKYWKTVNVSLGVPLNAMLLSMAVQLSLGLIYFGSETAFNAFSSSGVIFLTVSYAVPVMISLATGRRHVKGGSFNLGILGAFCNVVALCMPPLLSYSVLLTNI
jgi:amino acid transporter